MNSIEFVFPLERCGFVMRNIRSDYISGRRLIVSGRGINGQILVSSHHPP